MRTARWTYGKNMLTGLVELYDRQADPAQLVNLAGRPEYRQTVAVLDSRMRQLRDCSGFACHESFYLPVPGPTNG